MSLPRPIVATARSPIRTGGILVASTSCVTNETSGHAIRRLLHVHARTGSGTVAYMTCLTMMARAAQTKTLAGEVTETGSPPMSNRTPSPTVRMAAVANRSTDTASRNRTNLGRGVVDLSTEATSAVVSVIVIRTFGRLRGGGSALRQQLRCHPTFPILRPTTFPFLSDDEVERISQGV